MKEIACIGDERFTLGFHLTGIRKIVTVDERNNVLERLYTLKRDKDIGLVIVDDSILDRFDREELVDIEDSIDPIFIFLPGKSVSDNIRKLIIRSIGVDLMLK